MWRLVWHSYVRTGMAPAIAQLQPPGACCLALLPLQCGSTPWTPRCCRNAPAKTAPNTVFIDCAGVAGAGAEPPGRGALPAVGPVCDGGRPAAAPAPPHPPTPQRIETGEHSPACLILRSHDRLQRWSESQSAQMTEGRKCLQSTPRVWFVASQSVCTVT
jgi:hypothetical protein